MGALGQNIVMFGTKHRKVWEKHKEEVTQN